jgi:hypothetical protein
LDRFQELMVAGRWGGLEWWMSGFANEFREGCRDFNLH